MLGVVFRAQVKGINLSSVRITELQKVQRIVRLIQETLYNHGGHFMRCEACDSVGGLRALARFCADFLTNSR